MFLDPVELLRLDGPHRAELKRQFGGNRRGDRHLKLWQRAARFGEVVGSWLTAPGRRDAVSPLFPPAAHLIVSTMALHGHVPPPTGFSPSQWQPYAREAHRE
jgi:hypothetical protein